MKHFRKIEFEFFSNSAFSQNFRDFLDKYCYISVAVKDISKISTVMNSWDVELKYRVPFKKKFIKEHCQKCLKIKNTYYAITF
jgi:predicted NACHT family NTPase